MNFLRQNLTIPITITTTFRVIDAVDPEGEGLYDFQFFLKIMANFDQKVITEEELLTVRFSNDSDSTLEENGTTTD